VIPYFLHTVLYPPQMQNKAIAEESKAKWNNKVCKSLVFDCFC
jgi:hypothetical protein